MTISIIGHGYVGLVTAVILADLGNTVWCVGRTKEKIEKLKQGKAPFFEPGLAELLRRNLKAGRLKFTLSYNQAVPLSEVVFICVGTPSKDNGEADLTQVFNVAASIAKNLTDYTVVVTKSTVPVGTNEKVKTLVNKTKKKKARFDIASCPEFLREGTAISDTLAPDRIVIGTDSKKAQKILLELHKPIKGERVLLSIREAEMIKYVSNALLATKISFANMIAFLSEKIGVDVEKILDGVGLDKRLGRVFLYPGVGYGGSCLPKDVKALVNTGENFGETMGILKEVEAVNQEAISKFVQKIVKSLDEQLRGKTIAVLGLSFKPNTDDLREAPSLKILFALKKKGPGLKINVYDPQAMEKAKILLKDVIYCKSPYEAVKGAHVLVVVTEWNEFCQLDLKRIKKLMRKPIILDGRNIYDPKKVKKLGFKYLGVGRR